MLFKLLNFKDTTKPTDFREKKVVKKLIFFYPAKLSCLGKRQWKDSLRYGKVQKASLPCAFLEDCFEDTSQALM